MVTAAGQPTYFDLDLAGSATYNWYNYLQRMGYFNPTPPNGWEEAEYVQTLLNSTGSTVAAEILPIGIDTYSK